MENPQVSAVSVLHLSSLLLFLILLLLLLVLVVLPLLTILFREGLFILTNFRILFVPFKIVSRTVSLIYPPSSSSPSRSSSLFLDATGVKEGLYGSFCPIIRRFPENNPIQDEDLADLVDLGAQTDQEGPPSWVKTTLKDKMGKKENLLHLAPLQWVETKGGRKGGKRSKRESGFKPRGAGLPGVVEWTNKGVCDNARIISIPLGMIYEIYELFDQNSVFFLFFFFFFLFFLFSFFLNLFLPTGRKRIILAKVTPRRPPLQNSWRYSGFYKFVREQEKEERGVLLSYTLLFSWS